MRVILPIRWALFLLTLLLSRASFASVEESKDSILDLRMHRSLTTMAEQIGTGDTVFSKDHAVAVISWAGCNFTLVVVGPVEGNAKRYAEVVDAWRERQGLKGTVKWSQEDDCAAAKFSYVPGRLGTTEATTTIDLASLREAMLTVEPHTEFAVIDVAWSKIDLNIPPGGTSNTGARYWNLTDTKVGLGPVHGTIHLPSWLPGILLAWFLVPPLGILACFGFGYAIAKNEKWSIKERRRRYGKAVLGGTYGVLGFHSLLVVATLPTRAFDPMAQLWFGTRFTQLALPIVPLFFGVPLLALPLMNKVEKRLLGPTDEEKLLQTPEAVPPRRTEATPRTTLTYIGWALRIIGIGVFLLSFALPKSVTYRAVLPPIGMVLFLLPLFVLARRSSLPRFVVDPVTVAALEEKLRVYVAAMSERLDMKAPNSRVLTEAIYGRFAAILDRQGVGISIGAMEELTQGELEFLIAHELAHEKLGHLKMRRLGLYLMMPFMLIPFILLTFGRSAMLATPAFLFTPMLIPVVLMVPFTTYQLRVKRRQEFEADRLAIQTTGDPETAKIALRKITLNSTNPGIHDMDISAHPTVEARLAAMG